MKYQFKLPDGLQITFTTNKPINYEDAVEFALGALNQGLYTPAELLAEEFDLPVEEADAALLEAEDKLEWETEIL